MSQWGHVRYLRLGQRWIRAIPLVGTNEEGAIVDESFIGSIQWLDVFTTGPTTLAFEQEWVGRPYQEWLDAPVRQ